jgi:hypothetical protein
VEHLQQETATLRKQMQKVKEQFVQQKVRLGKRVLGVLLSSLSVAVEQNQKEGSIESFLPFLKAYLF